jgi:hypothetical protein
VVKNKGVERAVWWHNHAIEAPHVLEVKVQRLLSEANSEVPSAKSGRVFGCEPLSEALNIGSVF